MINQKYYNDIKQFPHQFNKGYEIFDSYNYSASDKNYNKIILCGMGGSALYSDILNNIYDSLPEAKNRITVIQSYDIPMNTDKDTLFIVASYSGNTEETLSCLEQILEKKYDCFVVTAGGELLKKAMELNLSYFQIPTGLQPRLSTGFFMVAVSEMLSHLGLNPSLKKYFIQAASKLDQNLEEEKTILLAKNLKNKIPVIYSTENNWSVSRVSKIKFNENSKIQSFWNFFPELNHNEMVGFTQMLMTPFFIILKSKFTHERNIKRINIFEQIMKKKQLDVKILELDGNNVIEEMISAYYFIDHVTYYLAQEYNIDPEPVAMVEDFKKALE